MANRTGAYDQLAVGSGVLGDEELVGCAVKVETALASGRDRWSSAAPDRDGARHVEGGRRGCDAAHADGERRPVDEQEVSTTNTCDPKVHVDASGVDDNFGVDGSRKRQACGSGTGDPSAHLDDTSVRDAANTTGGVDL